MYCTQEMNTMKKVGHFHSINYRTESNCPAPARSNDGNDDADPDEFDAGPVPSTSNAPQRPPFRELKIPQNLKVEPQNGQKIRLIFRTK